jgi:23S rRNA U2552 (ribose-2'-O)-methylase RlmE/FtsJ
MRQCSQQQTSQLLRQLPRSVAASCTHSIASTLSPFGPTLLPSKSPFSVSPLRAAWSFYVYGKIPRCEALVQTRLYSSKRWVDRQSRDQFAKAARVSGLKSRAAFKLLQINDRYRLFRPGMTIVDLGFAPGSWSQVAVDLTKPNGRVLGVDLIPAQPPKGVNAVQGDFLSPDVQREIKNFLRDPDRGRPRRSTILATPEEVVSEDMIRETTSQSYLDLEREEYSEEEDEDPAGEHNDKCVDVVLSDMCEPWPITDGLYIKSKVNPYIRLMNTSGNTFRDHAGSMVRTTNTQGTWVPVTDCRRISAMLPCNSASRRSRRAATSFASSTRALRTKLSRRASSRCSTKFTEKSPKVREVRARRPTSSVSSALLRRRSYHDLNNTDSVHSDSRESRSSPDNVTLYPFLQATLLPFPRRRYTPVVRVDTALWSLLSFNFIIQRFEKPLSSEQPCLQHHLGPCKFQPTLADLCLQTG